MRQRRRNRLENYDYSRDGYYFVTICVEDRREWFGKVEEGEMVLNRYGKFVNQCWDDLPNHYLNCSLDIFVTMPNHVHAIIVIRNKDAVGNGFKPFPTHGLSEIVRGFKTFSSRRINEETKDNRGFEWQKSFYDHVIRNEKSLENLWQYIMYNPLKWELDIENGVGTFALEKSCKDYYGEIIAGR
jgi:REP element-mobilizing transposase RayT